MATCPECLETISDGATRCPHCTSEIPQPVFGSEKLGIILNFFCGGSAIGFVLGLFIFPDYVWEITVIGGLGVSYLIFTKLNLEFIFHF